MAGDLILDIDRVAAGGAGIGVDPNGRIALVAGAIPGERVQVDLIREHKRHADGVVVDVVRPSPDRRRPPCPVADRCGGCDWQHVEPAAASSLRRAIVADCLRRLARLENVEIRTGPELAPERYRTTLRAAVRGDRAGFRAARSTEVVVAESCLVAHPLAEELLVDGRFPGATEVVIKVGAATGERMVVIAGGDIDRVSVPEDVIVASSSSSDGACIHEVIGERRFRISADSFFQCRPDGTEALVGLVSAAIGATDGPLVDAYAGVGLFGALLGEGRSVTAIESSASSVADARVNLPAGSRVVKSQVEQWAPTPAAVVVADPPRSGLGRRGAEAVAATGSSVIALVSCDPASLARDAGLLVEDGYGLESVTTLDLFGQTSHVETVSVFRR